MSVDARRLAFYQEMDKLRGQARSPDPIEIVRLALKTGFKGREALRELSRLDPNRITSQQDIDLLPTFISALCEKSKSGSVLEYSCTTSLLTTYLPEQANTQQVTFATPDPEVAETLRALVEPSSSTVALGLPALAGSARWDLIVCQPPMGRKPAGDSADGFGGEVVRELATRLAQQGTLYWVTGRGVLYGQRARNTFADLAASGVNPVASIDLGPGVFPGTAIAGVIIALRREIPAKKFVGALRDSDTAGRMASAFLAGPTQKAAANWQWLDASDRNTFADLEQSRALQKLTPRGRHTLMTLGSLLKSQEVIRADRPLVDETATSFLFIPEYAGSRVTAKLEEQTVNPRAVYRLTLDPAKANPRFIARILNSPYGRHCRQATARGATIPRTSVDSLLSLELPIPDREMQDRIAQIDSDIGLLEASFREMQNALDLDWKRLPEVAETIDKLKAVQDIERQIADWWRELPYPLATIYRRFQVSTDPKDRLEILLHFFEMAAIYLATIGASHVRVMRNDWQEVMAKWLHPPGTAGVERADFGFWIGLAGASLKDVARIGSDKDLRDAASEVAGPELVQIAGEISPLGKANEILNVARRYRNSWKGHGGHVKPSDAARLVIELQQSVRDLYEATASIFRRLQLVRPGLAEVTDTGLKFQIERLAGSDPTFERLHVEIDRPAKSNSLAFWMKDSRVMCRALPFLRLGAPQQPRETSFYVFNRIEEGGCRWISYQEAHEQEFVAPDEELLTLIALGKESR